MTPLRALPMVLAATCFAVGATLPAQTIDTRGPESRGVVTTPAFGQTFTVPLGASTIESFSFFFATNGAEVSSPVTTFYAYLVAWDGTAPQGDILYQSALRNAGACCTVLQETFETGGLAVSAGSTYLAFIAPVFGSLVNTRPSLDLMYLDTYAGGTAAFAHSCGEAVTSCSWAQVPAGDNDFVATFAATDPTPVSVPEPRSAALLAVGVATLLGLGIRRERRTQW